MRFDVTAHGPLNGRASLPGDLYLTLSAMAFGMLSPETVSVVNPSPSPEVLKFRKYLEGNGIRFQDLPDGFSIHGKMNDKDISIGNEVPDAIIHIVTGSAVFSGKTVTIRLEMERRSSIVRKLIDVLKNSGLSVEHIAEEENCVTIREASFVPGSEISVRSAWALEAVTASAMAAGKDVTVSYPAQTASHSVRLLALLGYQSNAYGEMKSRDAELARRLAKAQGEPSRETCRFEWTGEPCKTIRIPGDTVLAAAVAGAAAVIQRSDVVLEDVLWEKGRRGFFETLRRMKGNITYEPFHRKNSFESAEIKIGWSKLEGVHITSGQALTMAAEIPVLGALAAFAVGETVVSDIIDGPGPGRDVFSALAHGLEMLGAHVGDYADGIVIKGGQELRGNLVDSCLSPGIALALAVAGLNSSGTTTVFGFEEDAFPVSKFMRIIKELS